MSLIIWDHECIEDFNLRVVFPQNSGSRVDDLKVKNGEKYYENQIMKIWSKPF